MNCVQVAYIACSCVYVVCVHAIVVCDVIKHTQRWHVGVCVLVLIVLKHLFLFCSILRIVLMNVWPCCYFTCEDAEAGGIWGGLRRIEGGLRRGDWGGWTGTVLKMGLRRGPGVGWGWIEGGLSKGAQGWDWEWAEGAFERGLRGGLSLYWGWGWGGDWGWDTHICGYVHACTCTWQCKSTCGHAHAWACPCTHCVHTNVFKCNFIGAIFRALTSSTMRSLLPGLLLLKQHHVIVLLTGQVETKTSSYRSYGLLKQSIVFIICSLRLVVVTCIFFFKAVSPQSNWRIYLFIYLSLYISAHPRE